MAKKKPNQPAEIESVRHKDKRKNILTEELRDFVADEEQRPRTVLYPRDPSLDPQLVWKGKDEQDRQDLEVPAVPIYIQEKVHPQALIEDFRRGATQAPAGDEQLDLFADFNGLDDFDNKVDFYHHDQHWSNRMILGDSLLVMTSYDPTTGAIRSSCTDDIACWFIDTNYNGESFFVRHAYFTGADEPYEKLKRALRAEIDEAAWSQLYSTRSRPFDRPQTGKIAVKSSTTMAMRC